MKRILLPERSDWKQQAETLGFNFHSMYGEPYWDESRAYQFTLRQIEDDLEDVTAEIYGLCLELVDKAVQNEQMMRALQLPEKYWDWIAQSWKNFEPALYGRFDFVYDGNGPAKMLEFNADTPTSLYETGFFQWNWLEDQLSRGGIPQQADQFNSLQDKLIGRLSQILEAGDHLHLSCVKDAIEDRATVRYLQDCARQAGLQDHFVYIEDIGVDEQFQFADQEEYVIENLFKLYPYEDMFRESYGPILPKTNMRLIEPPWKAILSNKAMLPLLWEMFKGHPNLLPSYFEQDEDKSDLTDRYVRKPIFSREGANVSIMEGAQVTEEAQGPYGVEGFIQQAYCPVPQYGEDFTVIGSWVIGDEPAGIGIREDRSQITKDLSRFVPHYICD
ncbi:Glutathionylspermidine synthase [Pseudovibrio ascidiaceicola]|uniref:Glutathionylspermidine synthase n=1 Tax=Pseudovibrio ascidiaceicola TaxID=285279 RepID=A0A1I3YJX4_9HYPH|nr:glutathionylspermidine synthase family protein [Pseudovibrio ascidiaceicola]SFK32073.1 Glutathionylspermidine synthase [Pseudovibrio ascidiaceicola]